ncbi:MAG TPA: SCO family protein [Acidisarcina sp.]
MFDLKALEVRLLSVMIALTAALTALAGCSRPQHTTEAAILPGKQYHVRGKVVSTDQSKGEVTLDSDAIPGFMEAMTMPYKLKDPGIVNELHPGDEITATLLVNDIDDRLDQVVVTAQAQPDYKPTIIYNELKPGDPVPDFKLLNQSGRQIHLSQFRGKVLLITFIYTRCPLPEYCSRMSRNFAEIDKALEKDPALYARSHLLSISFDPDYDTPPVLRSYGGAYTGRFTTENFAHWDFASPSKADLPKITNFFVVGVTPEQDKTLTHSLSTLVIAPDGKVYRWYPTNEWTPGQLLHDVRDLLTNRPG